MIAGNAHACKPFRVSGFAPHKRHLGFLRTREAARPDATKPVSWKHGDQVALIRMSASTSRAALALTIAFLLTAGGAWVYSRSPELARELPMFIPVVDTAFLVGDLVTATLLLTEAFVFRSRALMVLAAGYLFTGLMVIPHALTFPGAFGPSGVLGGGPSSTAWLAAFWRAGFPIAVLAYALLASAAPVPGRRRRLQLGVCVGGAGFAAFAFSLLAIQGEDLLPTLSAGTRNWYYPNMIALNAGLIALSLSSLAILIRQRKSRLDTWLALSLWTWVLHLLLITISSGRFTPVWYFAYGAGLLSHFIVLFGLIADTGQTYARLAVSVLAEKRERDSKLLTLDAMASAMAHEVKQPLAAIRLHVSAARDQATKAAFHAQGIARSLDHIDDCVRQTFEVMESVRSLLALPSAESSTFSLNDLVRETASLMRVELAQENVLLQLNLDERLPSIHAHRMQVQEILINLFLNAVQSLGETQGRTRHLEVRSAPMDGQNVLLEIRDNGVGIPRDELTQIFDPFFTTKKDGTGLGLSLCYSIVEEHAGRLWVSQAQEHGVTFHLQLPSVVPASTKRSPLRGPKNSAAAGAENSRGAPASFSLAHRLRALIPAIHG